MMLHSDIKELNLPSWENFKLNWEKRVLNRILEVEILRGPLCSYYRLPNTPKPKPTLTKSGLSKVKPTR
jgi:hypothetical protein